jgi:hypothetical protein
MKFGVSTFVTDEGIAPGPLARAIEERGFDSLFVAEHTHIPLSRKSPYPAGGELPRKYCRTLDPFIALTAAAAATERLLLGTGVALLVERDPIITAKEVASLDLVPGGARATRAFGKDIAIRGDAPGSLDTIICPMRLRWCLPSEEKAMSPSNPTR